MHPTYHSIVEDAARVQKHILLYEQVALSRLSEAGAVRIVDIAVSPPQLTDKGVVAAMSRQRYVPAGDEDNP
jgi:hypothetical protein